MVAKSEGLLGVNLGTGGCKLTIIDANGTILGSSFAEYRTYYPRHGWSEQNPDEWVQTFLLTLNKVLQTSGLSGSDIAALAVDGSTHNAVLMGKNERILRPCIMWTDQRSIQQVKKLEEKIGDKIFRITFNKVNPTWTLPQLLWVNENEPEIMSQVERIFFTKDYLRYWLCGRWETDYIDAQGSMFFDGSKREWSEDLIREVNLSPTVFPKVVKPTSVSRNHFKASLNGNWAPRRDSDRRGNFGHRCGRLRCRSHLSRPGHC